MTAALTREVAITRDEFLRQLPDAIDGRQFNVDGDTITVDDDGSKQVIITLTEQETVQQGELELPRQQVDFEFKNFSDEEARMFMQTYDDHKMRVGGG